MSSHYQQQLESLTHAEQQSALRNIGRGIEKESLRVGPDGFLLITPAML